MAINSYVHFGFQGSADNCFWNSDYDILCFGDGYYKYNPLVSLDIVAHETGHGIMKYTGVFQSIHENRSLNEGFSDIWGAVIEHWDGTNGQNKDTWKIGEQIVLNGKDCMRSLRSPKTEGYNYVTDTGEPGHYPDTYAGDYWIDVSGCTFPDPQSNDDCWCHNNSTVLSHWFYLLSEGGNKTNDKNNYFDVWGLGIDVAADIVWRTQRYKLHNYQTAQYSDVMDQTIQAAVELFNNNPNSLEVMQVKNAWYAVGLDITKPKQMSIIGNSTVCNYGTKFTVTHVPDGCTISWSCTPNKMHFSGSTTDSTVLVFADQGGDGYLHATITSPNSTSATVKNENITLNPTPPVISGPAIVCSTGATFTLSAACPYDQIIWTRTPSSYLNITSGQGTLSCTFAAIGDGSSTISATIYVNGTSSTYSKSVWAGIPIFNSISGPNPPYGYKGCTGQPYTFWANPARDANSQSSYQWMVQPGYYNWYFQYQYYDWATIVFNDPYDYYQVIARASNTCGASNWIYKDVAIMQCYYFSMSPNPASDYIEVSITSSETQLSSSAANLKAAQNTILITNNAGIPVFSSKKAEKTFTIPVSNLQEGIYSVTINNGKESVTKQLVIKR
jgi:hypothetical protein